MNSPFLAVQRYCKAKNFFQIHHPIQFVSDENIKKQLIEFCRRKRLPYIGDLSEKAANYNASMAQIKWKSFKAFLKDSEDRYMEYLCEIEENLTF